MKNLFTTTRKNRTTAATRWAKLMCACVMLALVGGQSVWAAAHTPTDFASWTGASVVTVSSRDYEVYDLTDNATAWNLVALNGNNPVSASSGYKLGLYANSSFSVFTYPYGASTSSASGTWGTSDEFGNVSKDYIKIRAQQTITINIKGYDQFSYQAKDNGSGGDKRIWVTINGVQQTITGSTTAGTIWRFSLDPATEYTIVLTAGNATNSSDNNFYGFSLRLPSCTPSTYTGISANTVCAGTASTLTLTGLDHKGNGNNKVYYHINSDAVTNAVFSGTNSNEFSVSGSNGDVVTIDSIGGGTCKTIPVANKTCTLTVVAPPTATITTPATDVSSGYVGDAINLVANTATGGAWSVTGASTSTAQFGNVNNATTTFTPATAGDYTLTWTVPATSPCVGNVTATRTVSNITEKAADNTPPAFTSGTPTGTSATVSGNLVITFSENITLVDASKITISGGAGSLTTGSASVSGAVLTIPYTGLANSTAYTVSIDAGAVKDAADNMNEATASAYTFTTVAAALTAPIGLTETDKCSTQATLNWDAVTGADSYKVYVEKCTGEEEVTSLTYTKDNTTWDDGSAASTLATGNGITIAQIGTQGYNGYIKFGQTWNNNSLSDTGKDVVLITSSVANIDSIKLSFSSDGTSNDARPYVGFHSSKDFTIGTGTFTADLGCSVEHISSDRTIKNGKYVAPTGTKSIVIARNGSTCSSTAGLTQSWRLASITVYLAGGGQSCNAISGSPFTVTAPATLQALTGLDAESDYRYKVTAVRNPGIAAADTAQTAAWKTFSTDDAACCTLSGVSNPSAAETCAGTATTFTASADGATAYQWQYSADGTSDWANVADGTPANITYTNAATGILTVTPAAAAVASTGYYRCIIGDGSCEAPTASAILTVNALVNANAGEGKTATIGVGGVAATLAATLPAGFTGAWTNVTDGTGTFSDASSPNSTFTPAATGEYTLRWTLTATTGCLGTATDDMTVAVTNACTGVNTGCTPTIESTSVCKSTAFKLGLSTSQSGAKYRLYNELNQVVGAEKLGNGGQIEFDEIAGITTNTTYTVKGLDDGSGTYCSAEVLVSTITVTALNLPTITGASTATTSGTAVTLTGSSTGGTWTVVSNSAGAGLSALAGQTLTITPAATTGTVVVTYTAANGCVSAQKTLTISEPVVCDCTNPYALTFRTGDWNACSSGATNPVSRTNPNVTQVGDGGTGTATSLTLAADGVVSFTTTKPIKRIYIAGKFEQKTYIGNVWAYAFGDDEFVEQAATAGTGDHCIGFGTTGVEYDIAAVPNGATVFKLKALQGADIAYLDNIIFELCENSIPTPVPAAASSITSTGATLSWAAVSGAAKYQVKIGSGEWINSDNNGADLTYTATGLSSATQYAWQVRALVGTSLCPGAAADGTPFTTAAAAPEINVKIGATSYASGSTYEINDVTGYAAKTVTVTVENIGTAALTINSVVSSNTPQFAVTSSLITIAATADGTFTVGIPAGLSAGVYNATITIDNNDADEDTYTLLFAFTVCPDITEQTLVTPDLSLCGDGKATFGLSTSQVGVTYKLYKGGVYETGKDKNGTGAALSWEVTTPGTYTVKASVAGTPATCPAEVNMTGSAVVTDGDCPYTYECEGFEENIWPATASGTDNTPYNASTGTWKGRTFNITTTNPHDGTISLQPTGSNFYLITPKLTKGVGTITFWLTGKAGKLTKVYTTTSTTVNSSSTWSAAIGSYTVTTLNVWQKFEISINDITITGIKFDRDDSSLQFDDICITDACAKITTEPIGATVPQNSTKTLTVEAAGAGLTYQWYSSADNVVDAGDTPLGTAATEAVSTSAIGTLYYYAIVTGTCGKDTSNVVPVTVATAKTITVNVTPAAGGTVLVNDTPVAITAGTGTATVIENAPVTIVPQPAANYGFLRWGATGGSSPSLDILGKDTTVTVMFGLLDCETIYSTGALPTGWIAADQSGSPGADGVRLKYQGSSLTSPSTYSDVVSVSFDVKTNGSGSQTTGSKLQLFVGDDVLPIWQQKITRIDNSNFSTISLTGLSYPSAGIKIKFVVVTDNASGTSDDIQVKNVKICSLDATPPTLTFDPAKAPMNMLVPLTKQPTATSNEKLYKYEANSSVTALTTGDLTTHVKFYRLVQGTDNTWTEVAAVTATIDGAGKIITVTPNDSLTGMKYLQEYKMVVSDVCDQNGNLVTDQTVFWTVPPPAPRIKVEEVSVTVGGVTTPTGVVLANGAVVDMGTIFSSTANIQKLFRITNIGTATGPLVVSNVSDVSDGTIAMWTPGLSANLDAATAATPDTLYFTVEFSGASPDGNYTDLLTITTTNDVVLADRAFVLNFTGTVAGFVLPYTYESCGETLISATELKQDYTSLASIPDEVHLEGIAALFPAYNVYQAEGNCKPAGCSALRVGKGTNRLEIDIPASQGVGTVTIKWTAGGYRKAIIKYDNTVYFENNQFQKGGECYTNSIVIKKNEGAGHKVVIEFESFDENNNALTTLYYLNITPYSPDLKSAARDIIEFGTGVTDEKVRIYDDVIFVTYPSTYVGEIPTCLKATELVITGVSVSPAKNANACNRQGTGTLDDPYWFTYTVQAEDPTLTKTYKVYVEKGLDCVSGVYKDTIFYEVPMNQQDQLLEVLEINNCTCNVPASGKGSQYIIYYLDSNDSAPADGYKIAGPTTVCIGSSASYTVANAPVTNNPKFAWFFIDQEVKTAAQIAGDPINDNAIFILKNNDQAATDLLAQHPLWAGVLTTTYKGFTISGGADTRTMTLTAPTHITENVQVQIVVTFIDETCTWVNGLGDMTISANNLPPTAVTRLDMNDCATNGELRLTANGATGASKYSWYFTPDIDNRILMQSDSTILLNINNFSGDLAVRIEAQNACGISTSNLTTDIDFANSQTTWKGAVSNDWFDNRNWTQNVPKACTDVTIPNLHALSGARHYPIISESPHAGKYAECRNITFEQGGAVKGLEMLSYEKAFVRLDIQRDKWYTLTAPLKSMYSGDYYFNGNPIAYMKLFAATAHPDGKSKNPTGTFDNSFASNIESLTSGKGFAFNISSQSFNYPTKSPDGTYRITSPLANTVLTFPRMAADSSLVYQYVPYVASTGQLYPLSMAKTVNKEAMSTTDRGSIKSAYRFIMENAEGHITPQQIELQPGLNLIGNPMMTHLSFNDFQLQHEKLANKVKFWNGKNYVTMTQMQNGHEGGLGSCWSDADYTGDLIAPMQSFVVENESAGPITININPIDHCVPDLTCGNPLRATTQKPANRLYVTTDNGKSQSSTAIIKTDFANNELGSEDAAKLFSSYTEVPEVYTSAGNEQLDINFFREAPYITPLGLRSTSALRAASAGKITLKFNGAESFDADIDVFLVNALTGDEIDLKETHSYEYTMTEDAELGNLFVEFRKAQVVTDLPETSAGNIRIFAKDDNVIRAISPTDDPIKEIAVMTETGKTLIQLKGLNTIIYDATVNNGAHVYLVRVVTEREVKVEKVLLR